MELTLERFGFGNDSTLGIFLVDGMHECFSLEDERRVVKIPGETCFSPGRYKIRLRKAGGLHQKYKLRFPGIHKGMLHILNIPDFKWVYIHIGNDDDDTEGCPLTGRYPLVLPDGEFKVATSTEAYLRLYGKVIEAFERGEVVWIEVREREPHP
jgi:hypothetical protein